MAPQRRFLFCFDHHCSLSSLISGLFKMNLPAEIPKPKPLQTEKVPSAMQLGVWHVHYLDESWEAWWHKITTSLQTLQHLTIDLYTLSPIIFPLLCIAIFLKQTKFVLMWFIFNRILFWIEIGLVQGELAMSTIIFHVLGRATLVGTYAALDHWIAQAEDIVSTRLINHFDAMVFKWKARADVRTFQKNSMDADLSGADVWWAYHHILEGCGRIVSIVVQIYCSTAHFSSIPEAIFYTAIFFAKSLVDILLKPSLDKKSWVATSTNSDYNRLHGLRALVSSLGLKQDIVTNGLSGYLEREYRETSMRLRNTSIKHPTTQYMKQGGVSTSIVSELFGELHLFYFFFSALRSPSQFSLTKLIMLEDGGETISCQSRELLANFAFAQKELGSVRRMYELAAKPEVLVDGDVDYSSAASPLGMGLAMRNVSFSYNSDPEDYALRNVSFTIQPGQLVLIVGANGSGKSTLVKLLTRMYDPTSGSVVVDGKDIKDLKKDGLYQATALLPQDAHLYNGMSLAENIGIGDPRPEIVADRERIQAAARKGGAEFIESKYNEVLEPTAPELWDCKCEDSYKCSVCKLYYGYAKSKSLSGGELQRLAASRTFMRMASGNIKLVVADEPSASLDPEAEMKLFDALTSERCGKTMVFVTHRFGHTKHADLILCMKGGQLAEKGTHEELVALDGEYAKMYRTQGDAFS
ncbi:ABC transporter protein [Mycena indigotica]|uniref:ABC transporter protein n=1 Tax=Mycena indigotica TaxID=2126181 RepID=A0A8H6TCU3_9AGAR|nr:ABC transporter protein [Mycena indigotica]KAF7314959.1 ABC transporter protein [Mycena indigotica]